MTDDPGIPYPGLHPEPPSGEGQARRLEIHRERTHFAHCVPTAETVGYYAEEPTIHLDPTPHICAMFAFVQHRLIIHVTLFSVV